MIVADTSVLVKLVAPEPDSDIARQLRQDDIAAPSIWTAEAANALWRKTRKGEISANDASRFLRVLLNTIRTLSVEEIAQQALTLAVELDCPVYDCFFLQAAISEDSFVVTADKRFVAAVARNPKFRNRVQLLGAPAA